MAKKKAPKVKNKKELRDWIKSEGLQNIDKASLKQERTRLKKSKK